MNYQILWHKDAVQDLKKIDRKIALSIISKVEKYLARDPIKLGMPLKGNFKGFFRYRIGKFRVIYTIRENHLLILVLKVGKRDEVYDE
ncbi:MAG: type II toxin-antitoxin system RelE/ParE family toxin [Atribacterota bacterium]|mgnify:FL=1|jgi:mRNA interferase RelE/StbE|uniref:type II toxin-antitoxin system RelE family toxin n=1 Tax=Atribacter sp. TaxID=2847780 RepID=UPI0017577A47|nr:type II toxin-antitoxin system RelE/ParE family toxin [Atribacterota bacterium]HHT10299.1 type II toxin-antitoxin system RelE/ParE family toxin [Candidatus Atribacteria bacterium]